LSDALQVLAERQEQQLRLDGDLRTREAWVVESILARSEATWDLLARPTLRFALHGCPDSPPCQLELGRYTHLAALLDPTPGEQELMDSTVPCWARVSLHPERQASGQIGALAQRYVPVTTAEAVATLGMGTIISAIEHAVRAAGSDMRAQAERLNRRHEELVIMEHTLGWHDDQPSALPTAEAGVSSSWVAMLLIGRAGRPGRVLGAGFVGIFVTLLCLLFNPVLLFIALPLIVAGFLLWDRIAVA
jgi:hypothetical protein